MKRGEKSGLDAFVWGTCRQQTHVDVTEKPSTAPTKRGRLFQNQLDPRLHSQVQSTAVSSTTGTGKQCANITLTNSVFFPWP